MGQIWPASNWREGKGHLTPTPVRSLKPGKQQLHAIAPAADGEEMIDHAAHAERSFFMNMQ